MNIRELRPGDLSSIARVNVDTLKATHKGILSESYLNTLSYDNAEKRFIRLLEKTEKKTFIYIAEHKGNVIGYAMAGLAREQLEGFQGELYAIYILPNHHRVGAGKHLFYKVANHLEQFGVHSTFVWVFEKNLSAICFYEHIGGHRIFKRTVEIDGELVCEIAYGWLDMQSYLKQTGNNS